MKSMAVQATTSRKFCILWIISSIINILLIVGIIILGFYFGKTLIPSCDLEPSILSKEGSYVNNAAASDSEQCSRVATDIMDIQGGNAVDAAISAVVCSCSVNIHSCSIFGGSFFNIYLKKERKTYAIDIRETAAIKSSRDMYKNDSRTSSMGPLSIGVSGLASGLYEVHRKLGKIAWPKLLQPSINILRNGIPISNSLKKAMNSAFKRLPRSSFPTLVDLLTNKETGKPFEEGDLFKQPKLADTLEILSKEPYALHNGSLVETVVDEIDGIITKEDLLQYKTRWREPVLINLDSHTLLHTLPPPSSGSLNGFILNVLSNYAWKNCKFTCYNGGLFYHRLTETFKFAFATRSALGDEDFVNVTKIMANLTSESYARDIYSQITDDRTHQISYYHPKFELPDDHGTSHFSLISREGDAVAVTSTMNTYFGSFVMGNKTGIIYNNEMDDFSTPNRSNSYGLPPSPSNFISPHKRPMSSMSPVILTNKKSGDVQLVLGASGGSRIITAVAQVAGLVKFMNFSVKAAIDYPRLHHQLVPDYIQIENNFPKPIVDILKAKGHKFQKASGFSVVQGILASNFQGKQDSSKVKCNADFRKRGTCSGS